MPDNRKARRIKAALELRGEQPSSVSEVMNTPEAADYLRLSKPTLDRMRVQGGGPRYCKIGGSVRYRKSDLDSFLESKLVNSTSEAA